MNMKFHLPETLDPTQDASITLITIAFWNSRKRGAFASFTYLLTGLERASPEWAMFLWKLFP